jgi:hypothetical protein
MTARKTCTLAKDMISRARRYNLPPLPIVSIDVSHQFIVPWQGGPFNKKNVSVKVVFVRGINFKFISFYLRLT